MLTKIQKRDGRQVSFNIDKIADAIYKAARAVGGHDYATAMELAEEVCERLEQHFVANNILPSVEEVQDVVERVLVETGHAKTAKAYILYRADRTRVREMNTRLMKIYEDLTFKAASDCDIKRENANIDGDTAMGTMLKYGSEGAKQFYEMYVLSPDHSRAHVNGDIHIHDLDFFTLTTTCCQIDIIKLFNNGFSTGHGYLREPNNIGSYSALACIAVQSNQNDQHGGQSIPHFDYAMADGVRKSYRQLYEKNVIRGIGLYTDTFELDEITEKVREYMKKIETEKGVYPILAADNGYGEAERPLLAKLLGGDTESARKIQDFSIKLTEKETDRATFQAMEALVHNLNTMNSRAGAQTPFSSINYGTDVSPEGRMVIKNVLLANERGLGNSETPIFPIHIFKLKEGVNYNPEDTNYDLFKLACRVSAKRLYPNFSFLDAPFNLQFYREGDYDSEVAYMGCRTRVIANNNDKSRQVVCGRGNLSFTSINLPRLAIKSGGDTVRFFELLEDMMNLVISQLMYRFKIQCQKKVKNFPFLMGQGVWLDSDKLKPDDSVGEILKHGTLSMGFIGLAECMNCLIGSHHGETDEARELGLRIVRRMRARLDEESDKTGLNFTLLATPAEGLAGRFLRLDRKIFGEIKGITDHDYYTNSFHIPVYFDITAYEKIKIEAAYHALTNAGHITYVEMDGDPANNLEAFERVIRFMKESGVGYGAINHPVDHDPVCGFTGVIGDSCPACGRTEKEGGAFDRIRRITGYLVGTVDRFNNAKRAEEKERVKHNCSDGI
ncbi:MAG: anaerobic ribonucleoside triphosphate reductase [Oscillospiraceae bacterium]|jgi:ribonucleoside-triphosphate reductase|nr:anaerobic ribonucleoside triphosphate reductase [Oscillospiraceae bacterium]